MLESRNFSVKSSFSLIVAVDSAIPDIDKFFLILGSLKKRFELKVSLVLKNPESLFFNKKIINYLANEEVERVLITDQGQYFWFDLIEFGKRQESNYSIFCLAENIIEDWAGILKFITSILYSEYEYRICSNSKYLSCKQNYLRKIHFSNISSFSDLINSITKQYSEQKEAKIIYDENFNLFASKIGADRFGGINNFEQIESIVFNGRKVSDAKRIWLIDNQISLRKYLDQNLNMLKDEKIIRLPGIIETNKSNQVIIDINPGGRSDIGSALEGCIKIPRQLLTITLVKDISIKIANQKSIYIMSNYNKADYVAGALYGIAMQTHGDVSVEIIDDISTDNSNAVIEKFLTITDRERFPIRYLLNEKSRGTYWIRNSIIHSYIESEIFYLVNDSDDFSSSQRTSIQLSVHDLFGNTADINFGNVVRVDRNYTILALDEKVERYGTASLGAPVLVHKKYGYYENIKKNADTEFIERLRHFSGQQATKWFRYPVLFQPFDGNNLTSDIYVATSQGSIAQNLDARMIHRDLFKKNFEQYSMADLPKMYSFPDYSYPQRYLEDLQDFLI